MTVEKQIQDKIYELINNVNKTIPTDWDELYINSEMSETGGNVVWTIDNSGYINNSYPFEQMTLRDGWLYATDFYARRVKVDIKTGKIVDMIISK